MAEASVSEVEKICEKTPKIVNFTQVETISKKSKCKNGEYGLYLIYSGWALKDLKIFIKDIICSFDCDSIENLIGPMRIEYIRGEESEKTLALLHSSIFRKLTKEGFDKKMFAYDFRIQPYEIRDNNKPDIGYSSNLYIPLPGALNPDECKKDLLKKLNVLTKLDILSNGSYRLTLPVISRRTGESTRSVFIEFNQDISMNSRAITRLMLNDTDWVSQSSTNESKNYRVKCLWAANRQSRHKDIKRR